MDMTEENLRQWQGIEAQKAQLLARVAALDEKRQRTAPNSRVWSPLQIVQHLILFEQAYLRFIADSAAQGVSAKRPSRSPMIPLITWIVRKRISVPTIPTMEPPVQVRPLAELTAEWEVVRGELREKFDNGDSEKPLALNPVLGPLTVTQMLPLIAVHMDYHYQQIPHDPG